MAMDMKNKEGYVLNDETGIGDIKVSSNVIMTIAAVAALEVKGVHSLQGTAADEIVTMLKLKNLAQGVRIDIQNNQAKVALAIILEYGYSIPKISAQVQDKVKSAIETMTGMEVLSVNVRIGGVNIDKVK
ncbi:MAG: Asp23/Gls24 family envelope stress response protein [Alistipes sp.]|nr:Asp23/Gls24 family envelope stress response protein [Alistipes sp.]